MIGENYVRIVGFLQYPKLDKTQSGLDKFQGKVAVPFTVKDRATGTEKESFRYLKIAAWADVAVQLAGLPEGTPIKLEGEINERSYDANCKSCGGAEKKYWTDVVVRQFEVL